MSATVTPAESPARGPAFEKISANACLPCRKVKMKCHISNDNTICDRCIRKSFHCVFEKHRRGRKPVLRRTEPPCLTTATSDPSRGGNTASDQRQAIQEGLITTRSNPDTPEAPKERPHSDFWALLEGFRPSGVLNKQAMTGKLSLENITHGDNNSDTMPLTDQTGVIPANDPVRLGIVNSTIAAALFSSFMRELNPYICQFDPILHTFSYVQRKSAFLLSAILAASAKAFNPSLHASLREHAEEMFMKCFRTGKKSTEIIQAVLVLTYWKEPDDTRAWLSVGYVIRMCMELGWQKLTPKSEQKYRSMNETEQREVRNIERTWLLLFVYDRSLSLQTGGPSMIPRSEIIESAHTWHEDQNSIQEDRLLCALVTLRLIGSEVFDLLNPHRGSYQTTLLERTDGLMKVLLNDIHKWHKRWSTVPDMVGKDLYQFFVSFYATNLRLLFSLYPLHAALSSGLPEEMMDKQSLLISYSSAIEMLQLLVQPAFSPHLYFVQDSIHIMIAYAAIFLVKLLLSVPKDTQSEIEGPAIEAIRQAADMFNNHAAPATSGCGLQSKFLQNVLRVFRKAHEHQRRPGNHSQTSHITMSGMVPDSAMNGDGEPRTDMAMHNGSLPMSHLARHEDDIAQFDPSMGLPGMTFADDELWSSIFADAGFSINEGVFLPYGNELGNMGPPT